MSCFMCTILTLLHVHAIPHSKMLSYMWAEQACASERALEVIVDPLPYYTHVKFSEMLVQCLQKCKTNAWPQNKAVAKSSFVH